MFSKGGDLDSQVDNGMSDDDDDDDNSRSAGVMVDPARGHVLSLPPCGRSLPGNTGGGRVARLQLQLVRLPTGKGAVTVPVPVSFSLVRRINCLRGQPED